MAKPELPETQFTPGPWSVGPAHVAARRWFDDDGCKHTRFIAEAVLSAPFREGEREANARLIAAAPELYEALESVLAMHGSDIEETAARDKARAALAKARGEKL